MLILQAITPGKDIVHILDAIERVARRVKMEGQENPAENVETIRILVVDDVPAMLEVTVRLLDQEGYFVTAVTASEEAFTKIKNNPDALM